MTASTEQQAKQMERMAAAIILAINENGGGSDVQVIMGSLGAAAGAIARATGQPEECLRAMLKIAQGVASGELEV